MLNSSDEKITKQFTEFLFNLDTLQSYGMMIDRQIFTKEKGTQVSYYLHLPCLTAFKSTIDKIQQFENNINDKNDWDIDNFESEFKDDLEMYDLDLKEEIKHHLN